MDTDKACADSRGARGSRILRDTASLRTVELIAEIDRVLRNV